MLQSFHFLFSPLGNFLFSPLGNFLFSPLGNFLFSSLSLHLLPNLLLHGDTIVSMSVPVCSLASSATVARLQKKLFSQCNEDGGVRHLPTPCTFVVLQSWYVRMAEPADTFCIVIDAATVAGTSFSIVLSRFPSLLQNFLDLFLLYSIRAVPERTKLINWPRGESFNPTTRIPNSSVTQKVSVCHAKGVTFLGRWWVLQGAAKF